jgi:hypothetical protein
MRPDTKFTGNDLRKFDPKFQPPRFAQYLDAVQQLDDLAQKRYGKHVMDLAVRWVLDQPGITAALWAAPSCRTGSYGGRPRLEPRRGYARGDRSDPAADDRQSDRSRIHGAASKENRRRLGHMQLPMMFVNNRNRRPTTSGEELVQPSAKG